VLEDFLHAHGHHLTPPATPGLVCVHLDQHRVEEHAALAAIQKLQQAQEAAATLYVGPQALRETKLIGIAHLKKKKKKKGEAAVRRRQGEVLDCLSTRKKRTCKFDGEEKKKKNQSLVSPLVVLFPAPIAG
jgi:hypothetical protein